MRRTSDADGLFGKNMYLAADKKRPMHTVDHEMLKDLVIILGFSVVIILLFHRFRIPAILGFLITGIIIGPNGFRLIEASQEVSLFSEAGIIFLLFIIGIEFSLKELIKVKRTILVGGTVQVFLTIGAVAAFSWLMDLSLRESVFVGFLFSLSSTAIVLKLMQERGEVNTPQGRIVLAILIFQDIVVVPMILLTPLLADPTANISRDLLILLAKVAGIVLLLPVLARYAVPWMLNRVVKTKSQELFLLTLVVFCFATAWLTSALGLSLALGAFFAGLIISESPYSHQATANILPFREIFLSFFFVSVGMLLDVKFFLGHLWQIHLLAVGVIILKFGTASIAALLLRYPLRTSYLSALALAQVGEFAFLLSAVGLRDALLSPEVYQYFLAVSIISMGATPVIIHFSGPIADFLVRWPLSNRVLARLDAINRARNRGFERFEDYRDHLVIIGCGVNGQNLSKAARFSKIPYLVAELDPEVFDRARGSGEPVIFGDATSGEILKFLHVGTARMVVVAISDIEATKKIVASVRHFTETAYLVVRTRSVSEIEEMMTLGADDVIPEEFETSIKIFTRVLEKYLVPPENIDRYVNKIRSDHYEIFRKSSEPSIPESR